jgi:hypothetical protein
MARPQVADGDGLQIWRVAAENRQGVVLQLEGGVGRGVTTPPRKNKLVTKCHKGPRTWTDSLNISRTIGGFSRRAQFHKVS